MKGGRIVVESGGYAKPLYHYIENSMISLLSYDSAYGIILKLKYIGDANTCPYKVIEEHGGESPLKQIILKLSMVVDVNEAKWKKESKKTLTKLTNQKLAELEEDYNNLTPSKKLNYEKHYLMLKKQYMNDLPVQLENIDDIAMKDILYLIKVSNLDVDNRKIPKLVMSTPMFTSEVNQQFELVRESIQLYEPICPTVVYWGIKDLHPSISTQIRRTVLNKTGILEIIQKNIDKHGYDMLLLTVLEWLNTATIKDRINDKSLDYKIGIIAMELMDGYETLHSYDVSARDKMPMYVNFAAYELIRLGSMGFVHNDTHFNNILINPNVPYFPGDILGRAMLIDFGRTTKILDEKLISDCQLVLKDGNIDLMKSVLSRGVIYKRQIDIYSHYINYRILRKLIIARNEIIEERLQDDTYVKKANAYIRNYNRTTNRRERSLGWFTMKNAPLNRTRKASNSRIRRRSLSPSPSPNQYNSSFGRPKSASASLTNVSIANNELKSNMPPLTKVDNWVK